MKRDAIIMQLDMVLPFGNLAQVVYALNGSQFQKNEEAGGASAWNQTQLITVEPSIAIANHSPMSKEMSACCHWVWVKFRMHYYCSKKMNKMPNKNTNKSFK